jgi:hypothetical protein
VVVGWLAKTDVCFMNDKIANCGTKKVGRQMSLFCAILKVVEILLQFFV